MADTPSARLPAAMRSRTLVAIALAAAAAVAVVVLVGRAPDRGPPAGVVAPASPATGSPRLPSAALGLAPASTPDPAPPSPAAAPTTPPRPGTAVAPLPPAGLPVKQLLAELKTAAEQGNAAAGCRLGAELVACRDARRSPGMIGSTQAASCEGVSDAEIADAWRYLWSAAEQGNVAAMSKFARDPSISLTDLAVAAEGWDLYRNNAQRLLRQAVQGGDVMALYQYAFSTASGLTAGGKGVIERDPYAALVYGTAALPLLDPRRQEAVSRRNQTLASELLPEQIARAAREGEELRAKYFSSSAPTQPTEDDGYVDVADCAR